MRSLIALLCFTPLVGCVNLPLKTPASLGESNSGFSYIPLDPLPVEIQKGPGCSAPPNSSADLLNALPDNAVRVSIRQISGKGSLTLGPAAIGTEGSQYQVVLDYINADTSNIRFTMRTVRAGKKRLLSDYRNPTQPDSGTDTLEIVREETGPSTSEKPSPEDTVVVPVYVGVGLRLTANVQVLKGNVNLASLGALAASVDAQNATGSLIVQTLGINGKQVAASLPLPSELNSTTIQNAIQSLGSIKAIMYDTENTRILPRVTGIYNPLQINDQSLINAIVSELAKSPIAWKASCSGTGNAAAPLRQQSPSTSNTLKTP